MSFLNLEACTNLMRGYTKKLCADRHTPYQVCDNLVYRMLKSTHNGATPWYTILLLIFRYSRSQFDRELS